jgi:hypothetical protein
MTIQRKIWEYIKRMRQPVRARDIADALDMKVEEVGKCIWAMRRWCDIESQGRARRTTYTVSAWAEYKCPGTGNTIGSRMALRQWDWKKGLRVINANKKAKTTTRGMPNPAIALEECWGFYDKRRIPNRLDIQTGEVCPESTKAAD